MKHNYFFILATLGLLLPQSVQGRTIQLAPEALTASLFIDHAVPEANILRSAVQEAVGKNGNVAYHLFAHGRPGELLIDGQWLDRMAIASWLQRTRDLNDHSWLNIYACNFAKGEKGQKAVTYLESELGISVAASSNVTGANGDWILEVGSSPGVLCIPSYPSNLQDSDGDSEPDSSDLDDDNDGILDTDEGFFSQNIATGVDAFIVTADNGTPSVTNIGLTAIDATYAVRATEGIAYNCRPASEGGWGCVGVTSWNPDNISFDDWWYQDAKAIFVPNHDGLVNTWEDPDDGDLNNTGYANGANFDPIFSYDGNDITFNLNVTIPADLVDQDFVFSGTVWADDSAELLINGTSYPIPANSWWLNPIAISITISNADIVAGVNNFSIRLTDDNQVDSRAGVLLEGTLSTSKDTDGDGVADHLDLDADNDGITDLEEAGGTDADGDGVVDNTTDTDNDGLVDAYDTDNSGTAIGALDTDGDGVVDRIDLDSDNDGINDVVEAGITDTNNDGIVDSMTDADGDGFTDALDPNDNLVAGTGDGSGTPVPPADTDSDGIPNYQDLDSDNDGINDIVESGNAAADANNDGIADNPTTDADGDGIPDSVDDNAATFGDAGGSTPVNTDGDGVPDYRDLDSDNDGVLDITESGNAAADTDSDGLADGVDTDGDGIPDSIDDTAGTFGDAGDAGTGDDPSDPLDEFSGGSGLVTNPTIDTDGDGIADTVDTNNSGFGNALCGGATMEYAITNGTTNTTGYLWETGADVVSTATFGTIRATDYCESGGWRNYCNANEPDKMLFSIEMGANTTEIDYIEIRVDETASNRYDTSATNATFAFKRDWFVHTVGGAALTAPVNVRFYFPPSELQELLDDMIALANIDPAATAPTAADIIWFKKDTFDPSADISPDGSTLENGSGFVTLTPEVAPNASGVAEAIGTTIGNNINFVQFNGITGFSGGGAYVKQSGAALPIALSRFTASSEGCNAGLKWETANEIDFSHFELERSSDGRSYETIAVVEGKGGSALTTYEYEDRSPTSQTYYRLRMVDEDASDSYSEVVSVKTTCEEHTLRVYPNPIAKHAGLLNLAFTAIETETQLQIHDVFGRVVREFNVRTTADATNTVEIDVRDLPRGTYFLMLPETGSSEVFIVSE